MGVLLRSGRGAVLVRRLRNGPATYISPQSGFCITLGRLMDGDTIYAFATAPGRAGVALLRLSGPHAGAALHALAGRLPTPRHALVTRFSDPRSGEVIDRGIALFFPAPRSLTGEDVAELHVHGGRAVASALLAALAAQPGLRLAEPGEFSRRAFLNGKFDLTEAE